MQRKTDVVRVRKPHFQTSLPSNIAPSRVRFPHFPQVYGTPQQNAPRFVRNSATNFKKQPTAVEPFGDFLIESDNPSSAPFFDSEKLLSDFAKDDLFHFKDNAKDYLFKFTFASKTADDSKKEKQSAQGSKLQLQEPTSLTFEPDETSSTSTTTTIVPTITTTTTPASTTTTLEPNTTTPFLMIKEIFEQDDLPEEDKEYLTAEQLDDYMIILPLPFKFLKKDSPLLDRLG